MIEEKQIFTRKEIEIDLKNRYKDFSRPIWTLLIFSLLSNFVVLCFVLNKPITALWVCFVLITIITIVLLTATVLSIYKISHPIDYSIVLDKFVCETRKYYLGAFHLYFSFKTYGDFKLNYGQKVASELGTRFEPTKLRYYKWSPFGATDVKGMRQSSFPGDGFYLIVINNKIAYVYNSKIFEFKE